MKAFNFWIALFIALLVALFAVATTAEVHPASVSPAPWGDDSRWAVSLENDLLAAGDSDRDYTYGLNLTVAGSAAQHFPISPRHLQAGIDKALGVFRPESTHYANRYFSNHYSLELGVYGFTPDDIDIATPILDDRPYASLVYLQSSREQVDAANSVSWTSSLSLGVLGLDLVGSAQNKIHDLLDGNEAQGWGHQVSDGGELTAKYTLARQHIISASPGLEIKGIAQGSVGYITEASTGVSIRGGRFHSSWWSFDPDMANYGERSVPSVNSNPTTERYWWAGFNVKVRAYNVFLQGQFRSSEFTLETSDLNHLLVEAWAGYTLAFSNGYQVSYYLRGHSSEIRDGQGDRHLLWGGLVLAKHF